MMNMSSRCTEIIFSLTTCGIIDGHSLLPSSSLKHNFFADCLCNGTFPRQSDWEWEHPNHFVLTENCLKTIA